MEIKELERINNLIQKSEMQKVKAEGVIEKIKSDWEQKYGTSNINDIENILIQLQNSLQECNERKESLYQKILNSNDWDTLEKELL